MGAGARSTSGSRRRVVLVTIAAQAILMAVGWTLTFREVRSQVGQKFKDQIIESNVATTRAVGEKLAQTVDGAVEYGNEAWNMSQAVIESLSLPAGGFACLIDEDGNLLCHPDMRQDKSLLGVSLGHEELRKVDGQGATINDLTGDGISTGTVDFYGFQTHYIATKELPGLGARLLVHQPEEGLLSASEAATSGLLWISMGIGSIVLLATGLTTASLMRRHDRELEAINAGLEDEVDRRLQQAISTRDALILGLAKLADYRDTDTGTHLERIAEYSEILARQLASTHHEIDERYINRLRVASMLHDIGKVGVADSVLLKPGSLTKAERSRMEQHPVIGADTLLAIRRTMGRDELVDIAIVVTLEHHERWDGTGYPVGLAGEDIQLAARIVALADVYDALTSKRAYKAAMSHEKAAGIIIEERGRQFDPAVVDAFEACQDAFVAARQRLQPADDEPGDQAIPNLKAG